MRIRTLDRRIKFDKALFICVEIFIQSDKRDHQIKTQNEDPYEK